MKQSEVIVHDSGTSLVGPDAVNLARAIYLAHAISLYARTGLIPTRGVTITKMLAMASQYTGKKYSRSQKQQAMDDLNVWINTMKAALPYTDARTPKEGDK